MKTMTCKEMGGMCDYAMTASTPDEMIKVGMVHIEQSHPEMAADINKMSKDDPIMKAWYEKFMKDWDATPENA